MIYHSNNFAPSLVGLADEVQEATAILLTRPVDEFDGIVVQGMSGVIPAVPVSLALNKPLVVIRKSTDKCHDDRHININQVTPDSRWLFLDDFVSCGDTRARVQSAIRLAGGMVVAQYMCREAIYEKIDSWGTTRPGTRVTARADNLDTDTDPYSLPF